MAGSSRSRKRLHLHGGGVAKEFLNVHFLATGGVIREFESGAWIPAPRGLSPWTGIGRDREGDLFPKPFAIQGRKVLGVARLKPVRKPVVADRKG
jgi:hypothetical protein